MARVIYAITEGTPPFTVELFPSTKPVQVQLSTGIYDFTDVPNGYYTLTVTDALDCQISFPVDVSCSAEQCLICSPTELFSYAKSSTVVDDTIYIGGRGVNPYIVRFYNINDLSQYTRVQVMGVGSISQGLEAVGYSSLYNKLYFGARDNYSGNLAIIEVDPVTLAYVIHVIPMLSATMFGLGVDEDYIYGGNATEFFKIRMSDWSVVQSSDFTAEGFVNAYAVKVNPIREQFYVTNKGGGNLFAVVSMNDVSNFQIVDLTTYVYSPSDDIAFYDDGITCRVYVAGEYPLVYGAVEVNVTNGNSLTGISLLPAKGLFSYYDSIYSASSDGTLQVFNVNDLSTVGSFDLGTFVAGEITFVAGRLFIANDEATETSKLCEYICIEIPIPDDCDLGGTVYQLTTTTTTAEPTTTTTSSTEEHTTSTTTSSTTEYVSTTTTTSSTEEPGTTSTSTTEEQITTSSTTSSTSSTSSTTSTTSSTSSTTTTTTTVEGCIECEPYFEESTTTTSSTTVP